MYKLMIVDDELLMCVGICFMLNWEEFDFCVVGEVGNGKEGLEFVFEVFFDLIIMDIKMFIMDGLKFIKEVFFVLKNCKYVILSNFDEFYYVKEVLKLGVVDYLIKSEIIEIFLIELFMKIRQKL